MCVFPLVAGLEKKSSQSSCAELSRPIQSSHIAAAVLVGAAFHSFIHFYIVCMGSGCVCVCGIFEGTYNHKLVDILPQEQNPKKDQK